jgi:hypothetical protein
VAIGKKSRAASNSIIIALLVSSTCADIREARLLL